MTFEEQPAVFPDQKIWGAKGKKRQYLILEDAGNFTASYQRFKKPKTVYLIPYDSPVETFEEAKAVCEAAENEH